jgi:hypothetical protein
MLLELSVASEFSRRSVIRYAESIVELSKVRLDAPTFLAILSCVKTHSEN